VEQLEAELRLQSLHLMADGALGDTELLSSSRKTLVASRGFEGLQAVEWRKTPEHPET
jgi:hypothetical protein